MNNDDYSGSEEGYESGSPESEDFGSEWTDVQAMSRPSLSSDTSQFLMYMTASQAWPVLKKYISGLRITARYKKELLRVTAVYLSEDNARRYIPKPNKLLRFDPFTPLKLQAELDIRTTRIFATKWDRRQVNSRTLENTIISAVTAYMSRAQGIGAERGIAPQLPTRTITEHTQYSPDERRQIEKPQKSVIDTLLGR